MYICNNTSHLGYLKKALMVYEIRYEIWLYQDKPVYVKPIMLFTQTKMIEILCGADKWHTLPLSIPRVSMVC